VKRRKAEGRCMHENMAPWTGFSLQREGVDMFEYCQAIDLDLD
jgi:hypothetical protein